MNTKAKILKLFLALFLALFFASCASTPINSGATQQPCEFKFAVWGDTQFDTPAQFDKTLRETELLKPAFVVHTGDMITGYSYDKEKIRSQWARFKKDIEPLSMPFYPAPGNHDVTTTEIEPLYIEAWGEGNLYYSFDHNGSHFIILDTNLNARIDEIPDEEMEWLKNDLEQNKDAINIFLFFHSPLHLDAKFDWQSVHNLLLQYPVRAVFTGHAHIYDHRIMDGIRYFCINTSGAMNNSNHMTGYSHHFIYVTVVGDKTDYAVITEGRILPPEAVPPSEYMRAGSYFQDDATYIIPDTKDGAADIAVNALIKNRTGEIRTFTLLWETDNFDFRFDPLGAKFELRAGTERAVPFKLHIPKGSHNREELPKLKISMPYTNGAGYDTNIVSYHNLFCPPQTKALPLNGKLILDGRLDEAAWQDVPAITRLCLNKRGDLAREETIVKVLYDAENIHIGIKGEEPNPAGLKADAHGALPLVFADDDFEIYLDTKRDLKNFYRLMVNPKGTVFSSGPKGLFTYTFDIETFIGENYWSAGCRVPYAQIDAQPPKPGTQWGMNIRRARMQTDPAVSEWSRMRGFPAQPQFFGVVNFE